MKPLSMDLRERIVDASLNAAQLGCVGSVLKLVVYAGWPKQIGYLGGRKLREGCRGARSSDNGGMGRQRIQV